MSDFLSKRIQEKASALEAVKRKILIDLRKARDLKTEIRAYRDVLENLPELQTSANSKENQEVSSSSIAKIIPRLRTRMSDPWRKFMISLYRHYPKTQNIDELKALTRLVGMEISDENMRSQLSVYTSRGWLERAGTGNYRITPLGARAVGITALTEEPEQQDGQSEEELEEIDEEEEPRTEDNSNPDNKLLGFGRSSFGRS